MEIKSISKEQMKKLSINELGNLIDAYAEILLDRGFNKNETETFLLNICVIMNEIHSKFINESFSDLFGN